jgi:hypothetical protein
LCQEKLRQRLQKEIAAMLCPWPAISHALPESVAFKRKINGLLRSGVDRHVFLPSIGLSLSEVCVYLLATDDDGKRK